MHYEINPIIPVPELVTLEEAKDWMSIDFDDWDGLIRMLIKASLTQGEKITGKRLFPVEVKVFDNHCNEKYPVKPIHKSATDTSINPYTYEAGYTNETFPFDLKVAILQDVATGFSYRQNGIQEAVNATVNASIYTLRSYIDSPMI